MCHSQYTCIFITVVICSYSIYLCTSIRTSIYIVYSNFLSFASQASGHPCGPLQISDKFLLFHGLLLSQILLCFRSSNKWRSSGLSGRSRSTAGQFVDSLSPNSNVYYACSCGVPSLIVGRRLTMLPWFVLDVA